MNSDDMTQVEKYLINNTAMVYEKKDPIMSFIFDVVKTMNDGLYPKLQEIKKTEVAFNHYVIWPLLQAAVRAILDVEFEVGEIRLESMKAELSYYNKSKSEFYNADGVIIGTFGNKCIDLGLLETAGCFSGDPDVQKETRDYIKAGYGLVAMLHQIGRIYHYGGFDLFKQIKVFFVQVTSKKLRIWSLNMVEKELYVLEKCGGVDIEKTMESREVLCRSIVNLLCKLKDDVEEVVKNIGDLKESRTANVLKRIKGEMSLNPLPTNFKENMHIKLPDVYLKNTKNMRMTSSSD